MSAYTRYVDKSLDGLDERIARLEADSEVAKLNERLDRYEKRLQGIVDFFCDVLDSRYFWYMLGNIMGSR